MSGTYDKYDRYKELHRCYDCGKPTEPKSNGGYYVRCKACRTKSAEYQFERRHADDDRTAKKIP